MFLRKDAAPLCGQFLKRCTNILKGEGISYDEKVVAELIMKHMPDWRKVLNELQRYGSSGSIDTGILVSLSETSLNDLMIHLKEKNFKGMRQWVSNNIDSEPAAIYRKIYDNMNDYIDPQSIPQLVLILG